MKRPHKINHPSHAVITAFGASCVPFRLEGGQGNVFRCGNIVLKPAIANDETLWIARFYENHRSEKYRLPKPIKTPDDSIVFDGWQAWEYIVGEHDYKRYEDNIRIGIDFHKEIKHYKKPDFIDTRPSNPWIVADKVVWNEINYEINPKIRKYADALNAKVDSTIVFENQLIHGDFGENILFRNNQLPVIIDFTPYWRPLEFAVGIAIADCIVWEGADFDLINYADGLLDNFRQHLIRAELKRILELDTLNRIYGWDILNEIESHTPLIEHLIQK